MKDSFSLRELGSYRIERSEDYDTSEDKTYGEMIRVRGSKPKPPYFMVPSHIYKHSESELGPYLKDPKNTWRAISKVLDTDIDISDEEIVLHFPVSMSPKISSVIKFVKKRGSGIQSDAFREARSKTQFRKKYSEKWGKKIRCQNQRNLMVIFILLPKGWKMQGVKRS
ncbi:MAG: hypothetical protein M1113_04765 [Candidatus Thermoplasmatota archaeon]|nr:hypothetical protein [Candidatus Thermoplasmatota archaeon]